MVKPSMKIVSQTSINPSFALVVPLRILIPEAVKRIVASSVDHQRFVGWCKTKIKSDVKMALELQN